MNDLIFNIRLYFGNTPVDGCVDLKSSVSISASGIYEYLCSEPYAYTSSSEERTVTLKLRGNKSDYSDMELSPFRIVGDSFIINYSVCELVSDREYSENGVLFRELRLSCSDRSIEDE